MFREWNFGHGAHESNVEFTGGVNETIGNIAESASETLSDVFLDIYGGLGGKLGEIMKDGLQKAGLEQIFKDTLNPLKGIAAQFNLAIFDSFKSFGEQIGKSWNAVDQAAFDFAKQAGLAKEQAEGLRKRILDLSNAGAEFGRKYGKTLDQVLKLQSDFDIAIGRTVRFTNEQFKDISALSAVVGDEMAVKFSAQLDDFGMSTSAAGEMMTQMYNGSIKKGITLQAYSKNVTENLHLAQQYTFKDGVKGLMSMAENAAKTKMDMQQIVSLGNKLAEGGVEGAVNMAADLQVLGGSFAEFADPLALLHDGLLDMEGLSDKLTGLVGKMGRFNKETGKVDIGAFQQMQLREAAKTMGVDYGKLIESATHQAKRKEIENQMAGLGNIPEEYKEFIKNTAQFQNGKAGITDKNGNFKDLASLSASDIAEMAKYAQSDSENIRDIAEMLRGALDVQKGMEAEMENARATEYADQAEKYKGIYEKISQSREALLELVKYQRIAASMQIFSSMSNTISGLFSPIFSFFKKANGGIVKTHSEGDIITNGTPGKEYILNSAQHGEFIVNKESTKHHLALLRAINNDKTGNLRIKQYEDGGLLNTLTTGNGIGASMPIMGGMGIMGNMYQLQMINSIQGKYQHYVDGIQGRFSKTQGLIDARNNELNNVIANAKKEQQRLLNERRNTVMTKRGQLQNKIDFRNTEKEIAKARMALESNTKHQETLNSTIAKTKAQQAKIAKIGRVGMRVGGSAMAGVGAFMSAKAQYEATGEAIMNKQKAQAGSIGAGIGAAAGAALGSFAGPIGMMIGGAIGQMAGQAIGEAVGSESDEKMWNMRGKLAKDIDSAEGSNKFMRIKGDFSTKEQKVLASALNDGKLYEGEIKDEDLLTKLKETGNGQLIEKHARGGWIKGRTHSSGGELLGIWGGKIHEGEDSEAIIPADKAKKSTSLINALLDGRINDSTIKPIEPMGKQMKVNERYAQNQSPQTFKMEPININFNGSIKLETNDKSFDISEEIFKNPRLLNKITDLIVKQMNTDEHFAFNRKTFRKKYTTL